VVTQPFETSPFNGTGVVQLNFANAALDPHISDFTGNPTGPGEGFRMFPLWTGRGVGGGGLHFFMLYVRPTRTVLDGPLPSTMIPANNVSTFAFREAGGHEWSNERLQRILTDKVETYVGTSQDPQYRGTNGPETITQFPVSPEAQDLFAALSAASPAVYGGTLAPVVDDYNVPHTDNAVSSTQNFYLFSPSGVVIRQNSATAWANETIAALDAEGNLIGTGGRKLVIWTGRQVTRVVKDPRKSVRHCQYVAAGVELLHHNRLYFVRARNVIDSLGAGFSPLLWQRSGVGPRALLESAGIPVELDAPLIGQNLMNHYGPCILFSTTSSAFAGAQAEAFVQYENTPRRWQLVFLAPTAIPIGIITPAPFINVPPGASVFYCVSSILQPRSRGSMNLIEEDYGVQPNLLWGTFSDGPDPNDPASGLGDPSTDIRNACAIMDYIYQTLLNLRALKGGTDPYGIGLVNPPESVFQIPDQTARYAAYVPYITMYCYIEQHESGTLVMNRDPKRGVVNGRLRLHGTRNCFAASNAISPVMNAGNTGALCQAIGYNAGELIPKEAVLLRGDKCCKE
jgi:choline dehydrogenase